MRLGAWQQPRRVTMKTTQNHRNIERMMLFSVRILNSFLFLFTLIERQKHNLISSLNLNYNNEMTSLSQFSDLNFQKTTRFGARAQRIRCRRRADTVIEQVLPDRAR